jgi:hypothetical protein
MTPIKNNQDIYFDGCLVYFFDANVQPLHRLTNQGFLFYLYAPRNVHDYSSLHKRRYRWPVR